MALLSKEDLYKDLTNLLSSKLKVVESSQNRKIRVLIDVVIGLFLFSATAAVIWWQNSRIAVLYDLSGILENAMRLSQGAVPYRDFPFPYAPLTFLIQAALIRLTGAVYWHHIVYCCVVGGLATVLAWRILIYLFRDRLPKPRSTAFLLSLPLTILGIYCIFPHPFYDPDSTFVMLVSIFLLLRLEAKNFPIGRTFFAGMLLVVPLFIKQNIGIAFLGSSAIAFLLMIAYGLWKKTPVRQYLLLLAGAIVGFGVALLIINYTVGVENYKYWTITFAAMRRTPQFSEMLAMYTMPMLWLWGALFLIGAFLTRQDAHVTRWPSILAVTLMSAPFVWPVVYLLLDADASERAERLMGLWPLVLIASLLLAYVFVRRLSGIAAAMPFIIVSTANGVFLSQQLWGSTYGIWPLFIVLFGLILTLIFEPDEGHSGNGLIVFAGIVSVCLLIAGSFYVYSNERLDYVDFEDGEMMHSRLTQLQGLSMRGSYLPDFEELVKYSDENIPREDGILLWPGEDLFYYTTGREPHFPILTFDYSYNPYSPEEIREGVLAGGVEWIIIKNDTQIEVDATINSREAIFEPLKPYFRNVESLNNYEIYKRRHPDDPPDDADDDSGDDDDSGNSDDSGN